jgi:hypothetical protein
MFVIVGTLSASILEAFRSLLVAGSDSFIIIASTTGEKRMKALRMAVALGLVLGMTLVSTQAQAAAKKAKKKKSVTTTTHSTIRHSASTKQYIDGTTQSGRSGMFFTGAAEAPAVGHGNITGSVAYNSSSGWSGLDLPMVGINYGVVKNLELAASLPFQISSPDGGDSQTGLGVFSFGGKYVIPSQDVKFAVGLDILTGPVTKDLTGVRGTDVNPKGLITYRIPGAGGLVLNGELGFVITGDRSSDVSVPYWDGTGISYRTESFSTNPDDYIQLKAGLGVPFTPTLTGIGELAINQYGKEGSAMALGVRTGTKTKFQAMLGIGLGDAAPDFTLGGAVVFGI